MRSDLIIAAAQFRSISNDIPRNVERHCAFAHLAAQHGASLLVFPELSLTGYEPALARSCELTPGDARLEPLRSLAVETGMVIVAGAPVDPYLAALIFRPDHSVDTYTKQYLHPGEEAFFTPGTGGPVLEIGSDQVAFAICADTNHPEHAANAAARGATVYAAGVLITESGYGPDTTLLKRYATEHGMAVLMANHSGTTGGWVSAGKSAVWSEQEGLVAASDSDDEELVIGIREAGNWRGLICPVPDAARAAT